VKGVIQDDESDDVEAQFLQGQTLTTDEIETDPMKKLKNQITKAQKEYKSNNKQPDLPMYKATDVQRPEDIVAPSYEVRIKNAREKKQEKYDKLASKAF
jgi:ribosome-binding protein aMBF1 (putative translation factor)